MYKIDDNKKKILNNCCNVCSEVKLGDIIQSIGKDIDEKQNETSNLTPEQIKKINSMCESHSMLGDILGSIISKNNGGEKSAIEIDDNMKERINNSCIAFNSIGDLLSSMSEVVNFSAKSLTSSDITIQLSQSSYNYSGLNITPDVTVKDKEITLKKDTDYTVEYSNNLNSGTATVTVTGKGNYKDSKTSEFTINKVTLTPTAKANNKQYDGNATASGTITLSGAVNGENPTATGTFVFDDATGAIGNGKTVNVTVALDEGWDTNYALSTTSLTTTADITE